MAGGPIRPFDIDVAILDTVLRIGLWMRVYFSEELREIPYYVGDTVPITRRINPQPTHPIHKHTKTHTRKDTHDLGG